MPATTGRNIAATYTPNSLVAGVSDGTTRLSYNYDRLDRLVSERHFDAMDTPVHGTADGHPASSTASA